MKRLAEVTVHTFSNGAALMEFGGDVRPEQIESFKAFWREEVAKHKSPPIIQFGDTVVKVVDHPNPFGPDHTFDAISHAFGALGEYKEDEEIWAFIEALKQHEAGELT